MSSLQHVTIKKDGFYGNFHAYDEEADQHKEWQEKLVEEECVRALRFGVEIDQGVTFGDIARAVKEFKMLSAFVGCYNRCDIDAHNDYILTEPEKRSGLLRIEVSWNARFWTHRPHTENELDFFTDCYGVGPGEDGDETKFAIDLTPANQLAELPVVLVPSFRMYFMGDSVDGEGVVVKGKHPYLKVSHYFTLLDLLDALYEEVSFFGAPGGREEIIESLKDRMEEAKQQVEDGTALPVGETEDGYKIIMGDQVREFFGLPSNEEDRDAQVAESAGSDWEEDDDDGDEE